jgi:hypothetical protein
MTLGKLRSIWWGPNTLWDAYFCKFDGNKKNRLSSRSGWQNPPSRANQPCHRLAKGKRGRKNIANTNYHKNEHGTISLTFNVQHKKCICHCWRVLRSVRGVKGKNLRQTELVMMIKWLFSDSPHFVFIVLWADTFFFDDVMK